MSALDLLVTLEEVLGKPGWPDRVRELCAPDCVFVDVGPGVVTDIEGFIKTEQVMFQAWSEMSSEQVLLLGDNEHAVVELNYRNTQGGPLRWHGVDFPPSGRVYQGRFVRCITVENGKISSIRDYFNDVSFMRQLGIPTHIAETAPLVF